VFDRSLAEAVAVLVDADPERLRPAPASSLRLTQKRFVEHLQDMVAAVDAADARSLPHSALARWCGIGDGTCRGVLSRHPLIPQLQPVRAAIELKSQLSGRPRLGVIKLYAGVHDTQRMIRGVHARPKSNKARQLHLEFVVVTDDGRTVLVSNERYGVGDVLYDELHKTGSDAVRAERDRGVEATELLMDTYRQAIAGELQRRWGFHRTGSVPYTVEAHIDALVGDAVRSAELIGAGDLYEGLPIVGGQLVAATRDGAVPDDPEVPLVGHDPAAVERLLELGVQPVLDLNLVAANERRAITDLPYSVLLPRADGALIPHDGPALANAAADARRATQVERSELAVRSSTKLGVSYVDGKLDLPAAGRQSVRVYYRASLPIPHNFHLAPGVTNRPDRHRRALAAVVSDGTDLHTGDRALMRTVQATCARKGAFDPGGERANPTESLAAIAHLAADRELHRSQSEI
jgi:hypothetical protein